MAARALHLFSECLKSELKIKLFCQRGNGNLKKSRQAEKKKMKSATVVEDDNKNASGMEFQTVGFNMKM